LVPAADLINVFEVFLPQLLLYPNPTDPLNGDAAALLMREPTSYNSRVKGVQGMQPSAYSIQPSADGAATCREAASGRHVECNVRSSCFYSSFAASYQ
jgi:hypothetical protein